MPHSRSGVWSEAIATGRVAARRLRERARPAGGGPRGWFLPDQASAPTPVHMAPTASPCARYSLPLMKTLPFSWFVAFDRITRTPSSVGPDRAASGAYTPVKPLQDMSIAHAGV